MSSRSAVIFAPLLLLVAPATEASAQEVYGPTDFATAADADSDDPVPLVEPERCDEDIREDGAIVVCRERPDTERYLSPLPRPAEVHINTLGGLREPPCWVYGLGPPSCIRMGYVPPYPPMIDTTAFPEPLSPEEAAAVRAIENDGEEAELTGERVPIDLSGD